MYDNRWYRLFLDWARNLCVQRNRNLRVQQVFVLLPHRHQKVR